MIENTGVLGSGENLSHPSVQEYRVAKMKDRQHGYIPARGQYLGNIWPRHYLVGYKQFSVAQILKDRPPPITLNMHIYHAVGWTVRVKK